MAQRRKNPLHGRHSTRPKTAAERELKSAFLSYRARKRVFARFSDQLAADPSLELSKAFADRYDAADRAACGAYRRLLAASAALDADRERRAVTERDEPRVMDVPPFMRDLLDLFEGGESID